LGTASVVGDGAGAAASVIADIRTRTVVRIS
jgi:hypothetical protein